MGTAVPGAQLFTLRDFTRTIDDVRETLKKVADIGYRAVQVSGFGPMEPDAVTAATRAAGVEIAATHIGWDRFLWALGSNHGKCFESQSSKCAQRCRAGLRGRFGVENRGLGRTARRGALPQPHRLVLWR